MRLRFALRGIPRSLLAEVQIHRGQEVRRVLNACVVRARDVGRDCIQELERPLVER